MGERVEAGADPLSMLLGGPPAPSAAANLFGAPAPAASSAAADLFGTAPPTAAGPPELPERRPSLSAASLFAAAARDGSSAPPSSSSQGGASIAADPLSAAAAAFSAPPPTSAPAPADPLASLPTPSDEKPAPPSQPAPDLARAISEPTPSVPARPKRLPQFQRIDNYNNGASNQSSSHSESSLSNAGRSPPQPPLPSRPHPSGSIANSLMLSPLDQKVAAFMKDSKAKMIKEIIPDSVAPSFEAVQHMCHCGAWSRCLDMVRQMIGRQGEETEEEKSHENEMQLFQLELNAMVRMGNANGALQVLHSSRGCRIMENQEAGAVKLALVAADAEYHAGKTQAAVNRLSVLARQLSGKVELERSAPAGDAGAANGGSNAPSSMADALWCTLRQLVGYLIGNKEFSSAVAVQKMMLELVGASGIVSPLGNDAGSKTNVPLSSSSKGQTPMAPFTCFSLETRRRRTVMSLLHLTRIYLHLGDVRSAYRLTEAAAKVAEKERASVADDNDKNETALSAHILLNRGLVQFSSSDEDKAAASFEKALTEARAALEISLPFDMASANELGEPQGALSPLRGKDLLREVAITAANNLAVCALHRGTIFEAVAQIEAAVQENPQVFLHPQIVHNLKILYVVSLKPAAATAKNALIARLVELYHTTSTR